MHSALAPRDAARSLRTSLCDRSRGRYPPRARGKRIPLRHTRRSHCARHADHRPYSLSRHPAGLDGRVDLRAPERPPAGNRAGRRRAASSIATTRAGARCATRPSTAACSISPRRCRPAPARRNGPGRLMACPARKVIAAVVQLLEKTLIRVGNDEYARDNRSYGLTTMRDRHAKSVAGRRFDSGSAASAARSRHRHSTDARLARIVRRCQELPGQRALPVPGRRRRGAGHQLVGRERVPARRRRARTSRPRTSAPGPAPCSRRERCRRWADFASGTQAKRKRLAAVEAVARSARQHAIRLPQVLHPPGDHRLLHGSLTREDTQHASQPAACAVIVAQPDRNRGSGVVAASPP